MTYDVTYMRCVCVFPLYRQAWDLAVDICLSQLPTIIEEGTAFRVSVCVCERQISTEPLMPLMHHVVVFFGIKCMKLGG